MDAATNATRGDHQAPLGIEQVPDEPTAAVEPVRSAPDHATAIVQAPK